MSSGMPFSWIIIAAGIAVAVGAAVVVFVLAGKDKED